MIQEINIDLNCFEKSLLKAKLVVTRILKPKKNEWYVVTVQRVDIKKMQESVLPKKYVGGGK